MLCSLINVYEEYRSFSFASVSNRKKPLSHSTMAGPLLVMCTVVLQAKASVPQVMAVDSGTSSRGDPSGGTRPPREADTRSPRAQTVLEGNLFYYLYQLEVLIFSCIFHFIVRVSNVIK